ncbi:MAG: peroxiredoxin [Terasakiella sp.]|uniref:peroxiredoxin n=1 Tax=unclassified Terasakiella TaxID=2614952 RepID=UPI003B004657
MTIKVGDPIPAGTLAESTEFGDACPLGPNDVDVQAATAGKKIAIFAVPGAYTPTCSAEHVPSYLNNLDALKAKGVDEVWCVATNDGFVMAAWGKDQNAIGKIRFLGDGSAKWAKALGLELDLTDRNMGMRLQRFSLLVEDGIVTQLNIEGPGKFEVSGGDTLLSQLG